MNAQAMNIEKRDVTVQAGRVELEGMLWLPESADGLVVFAHGSGSSRHSPRNQFVAEQLNEKRLGTLLFDLLTPDEDEVDKVTRELRFDIPMLGERMAGAVGWVSEHEDLSELSVGLFGSSTGAAAALIAAANAPDRVEAVVSRGGRPDLADDVLDQVKAPTLLIIGGRDTQVIEMNRSAADKMTAAECQIEIVEGASHLFEESGKLEEVAELAGGFFKDKLA